MHTFTPKQLSLATINLLDNIMEEPIKPTYDPACPKWDILHQCPGADRYLNDEITQYILTYVTKFYAKHEEGHDVNHALNVLRNAINITQQNAIQLNHIQEIMFPLIMLGHDILDHKMIARGTIPDSNEVSNFYVTAIKMMSTHVGITYNATQCENIISHIHLNCSWSKRTISETCSDINDDILRLILQDADWLEAVGWISLHRCWSYSYDYWKRNILKNLEYRNVDKQEIYSMIMKIVDTKLIYIPDGMNFQKHLNDVVKRFHKIYVSSV
jgi:hypothetical protein